MTHTTAGAGNLLAAVGWASTSYLFIAGMGLGLNPLLAGLLITTGALFGCVAVATRQSTTIRTEGIRLMCELIKDDIHAARNGHDERWERWWNPLSKRSALKWLITSENILLAIGLTFIQPFIGAVLYHCWVLLLLPVMLSHRVFKQPTHTAGGKTALTLFLVGISGAFVVAYSQYADTNNTEFPFNNKYWLGIAATILATLIAVSFMHHLPSAQQLVARLPDNHPLIVEARSKSDNPAAWCVSVLGVAANAFGALISLILVTAALGAATATSQTILPTENLHLGGVTAVLVLMPATYALSLLYQYRGTQKTDNIAIQSIQYANAPATVLAFAAAGLLPYIGGNYWWADLRGATEFNWTYFVLGVAIILATNVTILAVLKQRDITTQLVTSPQ